MASGVWESATMGDIAEDANKSDRVSFFIKELVYVLEIKPLYEISLCLSSSFYMESNEVISVLII